jgi:hypothetical protein
MNLFSTKNPREASAKIVIATAALENPRATRDHGASLPTVKVQAPLWLRTGFCICVVIAIAVVVRRLMALADPSQGAPPQMAAMDQVFASRAALTIAHIVPAMFFVLLTPFVFLRRANAAWAEWLMFPLGAVVGATSYAMSVDAVGGWIERSAVLFFNTLFLYSLARAYGYARSGDQQLKRQWMTRAVGILLGIATTRPVMGVFFATSQRTHLQPGQFFGLAFWIGFSINTIIVELWLHWSGRQSQAESMTAYSVTQG